MIVEVWNDRPTEVAYLLNPAFTGVLMRLAVDGYKRESSRPMSFAMAFFVLPFSLHQRTGERLPAKATTNVEQWIQDNRDILVTFQSRMRTLVPFTKEGIVFAGQRGIISFDTEGKLAAGSYNLRGFAPLKRENPSIAKIFDRATFVGRWLGLSGSPVTLYSMLGVTP